MSMVIERVLAGLVVLAIAAGLSTALLATPSQAAGKMLKLSYGDNGPWLDNLPSSQVNVTDDELLVPAGEMNLQPFYAYNSSGVAGKLTLACTLSGANDFAGQLNVSYAVGAVGAVGPDSFVSCEEPSFGVSVPGRTAREVQVKVAFVDVDDQTAQNLTTSVGILVTLAGVLPGTAGGKPTVLGTEDFGNKPTSTTTSNGGATSNAGTSIPCDDPTRTVVTVVGQPRCPAVAGAQASAGSKKPTSGKLNTFAPLVGSTEPRSTTTLLPLTLGLLLAGGLLITLRRFASASRSRPTD